MNILLNASNVRHGGGVTVCLNLLNELVALRTEDRFWLVHPQGVGYEALSRFQHLTLLPVPDTFHRAYFTKYRYNEYVFRNWARDYAIDKVISLGNTAFRCDKKPQLLFIQNAHLVYPDSPVWKRMDWKSFLYNSLMDQWASSHLRLATAYVVQTDVMKARLIKRFELPPEKVFIISNAPDSASSTAPMRMPGGKWKLLFISHWYAHKNFECLVPLAQMISDNALPVTISLTLDPNENIRAKALLAEVEEKGLRHIVENIGHIPREKVGETMAAHDALFLPTLLETFSGAYAEALRAGRPIFTSNYDFTITPLGDAAWYFDPLNTESIYRTICDAWQDREAYAQKAAAAATLGASMPAWPEIAQHFSEVIDTFA